MDTYILIKYLKCAATPEEERQVRAWLADDPDGSHAKQYSDAHFMYEGMLLHSAPAKEKAAHRPRKKSHLGRAGRILTGAFAAAAALAIVVTGVWAWTKDSTMESLAATTETIYVPAGKSMELTLQDGTKVWLNSGTELEYPVVFSKKSRNVKLHQGEAMFDVTKDARRPFTVDTYASKVTVLGTRFNISANEADGEFSTTLLRGAVKVDNKLRQDESYVLRTNQMVSLNGTHLLLHRVDNPGAVDCWTAGLINVAGVPFDRLMKKFELAYDVDIIIERETLPEISYTRGKIRVSEGIEHALSMLALVSDLKYEYDRQTNTIYIR